MVEDEEILELVERNRDDLDKAVKALVSAANRGGGEDNITAVAFDRRSAPSGDDTVADAGVDGEADEPTRTREVSRAPPAVDTMVVPPDEVEPCSSSRLSRRRRPSTRREPIVTARTRRARPDDARPARRGRGAARLGAGACAEPTGTVSSLSSSSSALLTGDRLRHRLHRAASRRSPAARSTYAVFFFALYLVGAPRRARSPCRYADPYLLPMAALLTAIGVTEIYRLGPNDAFRQGTWIVIGVAVFARHALRAAPRLPRARELQVPLRRRRDRAALHARPAGDRPDA